MTALLLVKTSSLGDVVHNLPVVTDIRHALPGARIDWVVEASYAAIPRLHPAVHEVIPVEVRRWRRTWWRRDTRARIAELRSLLRGVRYDAVIDTQGLLKSALLARLAGGRRYGLDFKSSREPLGWLYDRTFRVPWNQHAVERNRALAAQALGYSKSDAVDYGIPSEGGDAAARHRYAVLLHATSARAKLWPDAAWIELGHWLHEAGTRAVLPWGNAGEQARSTRLAARIPGASVPNRLPLEDAARLLARAHLVVGVDTGLTHLAGALAVPTVGVYVATDPAATGLYACARAVNIGGKGHAPSSAESIAAAAHVLRLP
jgi:heptosyltransferase I